MQGTPVQRNRRAAAGLVLGWILAGAAHAVVIRVGDAGVPPGGSTAVDVRIETEGVNVVGCANTIEFAPPLAITFCEANPAAGREATSFTFLPEGCAIGTTCTSVRATVLSLVNLDPIPDGTVLYTCDVDVGAGATPGQDLPLACTEPEAANESGTPVPAECADGHVRVATPPPPTPTVTGTPPPPPTATIAPPSPSHTHTPRPQATPVIRVATVTGLPGGVVDVPVFLDAESSAVAATENVLTFDPRAPILDCERNPAIGREATAFGFRPPDCTPGIDCTSVKAIVLTFALPDAIPDGSELYRCTAVLAAGVPAGASLPVLCTLPGASDPEGRPLAAGCADGAIEVALPPTASPTPTSTATSTPTVTNTRTPTPTATPKPPPCPGDCDGDDMVNVDELIRSVALALGRPAPGCDAADLDGDGTITIDELIRAVRSALDGCPEGM